MKKIILSVLLFSSVTAGFCKTWAITNSGFAFSPATLTINLGDSVKFTLGGSHNAVEVSEATWNENGNTPLPGFSTAFGGGLVLPGQLTMGTHFYVCSPHASFGMKGTIIVQNTTGITRNSSNEGISIFPNPSNGNFQLEINSSKVTGNYLLEVYDLQGNKPYKNSDLKPQNSYRIDISSLPKGIYFVKLFDGAEIYIRQIIIQ